MFELIVWIVKGFGNEKKKQSGVWVGHGGGTMVLEFSNGILVIRRVAG